MTRILELFGVVDSSDFKTSALVEVPVTIFRLNEKCKFYSILLVELGGVEL